MAFAHVGNMGTALSTGNNQSSLVITTTATALVGSLVVVLVAVDNNQTTDGDSTAVSGVVDSAGNTYTRGKEFANGNGTNQTGADVSIWYKILTSQLTSGGTITASFTSATTADASAMTAKNFSVASGSTVAIEGTPGSLANDAASAGSLDVTTSNIACLRVRAIAAESSSTTALTPTAGGWAIFAQAVSGAGTSDTEMGIRGEWIINTATGAASAPTGGAGAVDHASAYVAFREVFTIQKAITTITQAQSASGVAAATGTRTLTGTPQVLGAALVANFSAGGGGPSVTQKVINILQGQSVSGVANAVLTLAAQTGAGLAQIVTVVGNYVVGGPATTQKVITVLQAQAVTLRRATQKTIALSHSIATYFTAEANHFYAITATGMGQSVRVLKSTGHRVTAALSQFVSKTIAVQKVIRVLQAQAVTLRRAMGKLVSLVMGQDVSGVAALNATGTTVTGNGQAQVITKTATFVSGGAAVTQKIITVSQSIYVYFTGEGNLLYEVTGPGQGQTIRLIKSIGHRVIAALGQAVTVVGNFVAGGSGPVVTQKVINVVQAQAITLRRSTMHIIAVAMGQAVTLTRATGKRITLTLGQTVSLLRATNKTIGLSQGGGASLLRQTNKILTIAQGQTVTMRRVVNKVIVAALNQAITIPRAISKIITLTQGQTVSRSSGRLSVINTGHGQLVTVSEVFVVFDPSAIVELHSLPFIMSTGQMSAR